MNKIIWNTGLVWFITLGFLFGISLVTFMTTKDGFTVFIITIFSAMFIAFIPIIITGINAARGAGHFPMGLTLAFVFGCFLLITKSHGFSPYGICIKSVPIILLPVLIYLVAFGLEYLRIHLYNSGQVKASWAVSAIAIGLCCIGVFIFCALQSKTTFAFLPRELFFVRPANDVTEVIVPNFKDSTEKTRLYSKENDAPFTGIITSYKEKLRIDLLSKKVSGITYYIDGLEFGTSGKVLPVGNYNSWDSSYAEADLWNIFDEQNSYTNTKVLLHKDYEEFIKRELPTENIIYYMELPLPLSSTYAPYSIGKITVVYDNGDSLVRKEVTFHGNGVVKWIESTTLKNGEWIQGIYENTNNGDIIDDTTTIIDSLGYSDNARFSNVSKSNGEWNKQDFVLSDFNTYDYLKEMQRTKQIDFKDIDKMIYVPYPHDWSLNSRFDNLIQSYNIKTQSIYVYLKQYAGDKFTYLSPKERSVLLNLIDSSPITLNILDSYWDIDNFQRDSIQFLIESDDGKHELCLYFHGDMLLVENGPYYIDFSRTIYDEEFSKTKRSDYKKFLDTIEQYTGKRLPTSLVDI